MKPFWLILLTVLLEGDPRSALEYNLPIGRFCYGSYAANSADEQSEQSIEASNRLTQPSENHSSAHNILFAFDEL